jgi:hypothetical protein
MKFFIGLFAFFVWLPLCAQVGLPLKISSTGSGANTMTSELKALSFHLEHYLKSNDPVEESYINNRCAALFLSIGARFQSEAERFRDQTAKESMQMSEKLNKRAEQLLDRSLKLSSKTGATPEFIQRQLNTLSLIYTQQITQNFEISNRALVGWVSEDWQLCLRY